MNSIQKTARMAGFFYFLYVLITIPSDVCRDRFIVPGNAAATANNIMASEWLFRLSFMGDLLSAVFFSFGSLGFIHVIEIGE